eukprot:scaffold13625_cov159-Alexandrium_tamarense.AAC.2
MSCSDVLSGGDVSPPSPDCWDGLDATGVADVERDGGAAMDAKGNGRSDEDDDNVNNNNRRRKSATKRKGYQLQSRLSTSDKCDVNNFGTPPSTMTAKPASVDADNGTPSTAPFFKSKTTNNNTSIPKTATTNFFSFHKSKSNTSTSSRTTTRPLKRQKTHKKQQQQLYLDFGQSTFGKQSICSLCGMLRVHGLQEDDDQHDKVCRDYKEGVVFGGGWKNERCVGRFGGCSSSSGGGGSGKSGGEEGRIVEVRPEDGVVMKQKVLEVKEIVDKEMGFAVASKRSGGEDGEDQLEGITSYLYIAKKRVVGLLLVKHVKRAYELLSNDDDTKGSHSNNDISKQTQQQHQHQHSLSRSLKPHKALLGIHQIWVHSSHRHQKIASNLVESARGNFIFGMTVPLELIAYSSPTLEGV